jgi:CRISPR-associated protein Csm2
MPNGADRPGARPQRGPQRHGGGGFGQGPRGGGGPPRQEEVPTIDLSAVGLKTPAPELFDEVAQAAAKTVSENRRRNKPSQIRKFFDELVMWESKLGSIRDGEERSARFREYLPFIRMLNAKVAYAEGRELVDKNFQALVGHCLKQVEDPATLRAFKLFFEAFLGYYKAFRPSDR